ncbi:putative Linear gramicidin synthase subunit C [Streptomyces aurantiacus JA 4570]|uniref:Putative Linear gramicidin synthase subunit C n=1 Tax=Streptomyces aurantiacus JA 4570 TaxID=1286094 RepID=S3ZQG0_9ACTN|nr:putative Linear gramicidin synthase subunit C [Streptomyces aurantiacus JA 4570]
MPAQVEEAVVDPDALDPEHLGEQPAQHLLPRGARRPARPRTGPVGGGQRTPVDLAVRVQRHLGEEQDHRRHHGGGQPLGHERAQVPGGRRGGARLGHHVPHEASVAVALVADDDGLGDVRVLAQRGLHLAEFDAVAADLDLVVGAPVEDELTVTAPGDDVPRAVHTAAGLAVRAGHEAFGSQARAAEVAAGQGVARQVQVARHTRRHGAQRVVEDVQARVDDGAADGRGAAVGGQRVAEGHEHRGLGRAVGVDHVPARGPGGHELGGGRVAADHQGVHGGQRAGRQRGEHGGRQEAVRDPPLGDRPGQRGARDQLVRRGEDQGGVGEQRRAQLVDRCVEARRGELQHAAGGVQAEAGELGRDEGGDAGVGDGHALGPPGRSRGVHDVRGVGDAERTAPLLVGHRAAVVPRHRRGDGRVVQPQDGHGQVGQFRRGDGVRHGQQGTGVGQHEGDPVRGIRRVHRQVDAAGLHHGEQRHHQVGRAAQRHRHRRLRRDTAPQQLAREPVGTGVHLRVRQRSVAAFERHRVGRRGCALLEHAGEGVRFDRRGGVVVPVQEVRALGGREQVEAADGRGGVGGDLPEDVREPLRDVLGGRAADEVRPVLQGHAQVRLGGDGHRERVVVAHERADTGDREAGAARVAVLHRVAHGCHQGVEQLARACGPVDVGEAAGVAGQGLLPLPQAAQHVRDGVRGREAHARGKRVDEKTGHRVDVRHRVRTPGHGHTEDHVLPSGQGAEEERPGALHQGVRRDAERVRLPGQRVRGLVGQAHLDLTEPVGPRVRRGGPRVHGLPRFGTDPGRPRRDDGREERRLRDPRQLLGPRLGGAVPVLLGQPHQEIAELGIPGRCGGIIARRVKALQIPYQNGQRKSVEKDLMGRQDKLVPLFPGPGQGHAQQGRRADVEGFVEFLRQQRVKGFPGGRLCLAACQVHRAPGQFHSRHDDLRQVSFGARQESHAQIRVPVQEGLTGGPHPLCVHRPSQVKYELHAIGALRGVAQQRVEEQTGLQRGQRPHVHEARTAPPPRLQLASTRRHQGHADRPERPVGLGHDLPYDPHEPLSERLGRLPVAPGVGVLEHTGRPAAGAAVKGAVQGERQPLAALCARVRRARVLFPYAPDQGGERRIVVPQIRRYRRGVGEEPHAARRASAGRNGLPAGPGSSDSPGCPRRPASPGDGQPHCQAVAPADTPQEHRERGLQHAEGRGAPLAGQRLDRVQEFAVEGEFHGADGAAGGVVRLTPGRTASPVSGVRRLQVPHERRRPPGAVTFAFAAHREADHVTVGAAPDQPGVAAAFGARDLTDRRRQRVRVQFALQAQDEHVRRNRRRIHATLHEPRPASHRRQTDH